MIAIRHARPLQPAEGTPRLDAGVLSRQAALLEFVGHQREMGLDLLLQVCVAAATAKKTGHTREPRSHDSPSSIRFTIATVRAQLSVSAASCFLPARVIE